MAATTIIVCDTCRWRPDSRQRPEDGKTGGEILAGFVEQAADGVAELRVQRHSCLMGCRRHCNAAIAAPGKIAFYFTHYAPVAESADALVAFARLHAASPDGTVPKPLWPAGVQGHFMGRIPALDAEGVDPPA